MNKFLKFILSIILYFFSIFILLLVFHNSVSAIKFNDVISILSLLATAITFGIGTFFIVLAIDAYSHINEIDKTEKNINEEAEKIATIHKDAAKNLEDIRRIKEAIEKDLKDVQTIKKDTSSAMNRFYEEIKGYNMLLISPIDSIIYITDKFIRESFEKELKQKKPNENFERFMKNLHLTRARLILKSNIEDEYTMNQALSVILTYGELEDKMLLLDLKGRRKTTKETKKLVARFLDEFEKKYSS